MVNSQQSPAFRIPVDFNLNNIFLLIGSNSQSPDGRTKMRVMVRRLSNFRELEIITTDE